MLHKTVLIGLKFLLFGLRMHNELSRAYFTSRNENLLSGGSSQYNVIRSIWFAYKHQLDTEISCETPNFFHLNCVRTPLHNLSLYWWIVVIAIKGRKRDEERSINEKRTWTFSTYATQDAAFKTRFVFTFHRRLHRRKAGTRVLCVIVLIEKHFELCDSDI